MNEKNMFFLNNVDGRKKCKLYSTGSGSPINLYEIALAFTKREKIYVGTTRLICRYLRPNCGRESLASYYESFVTYDGKEFTDYRDRESLDHDDAENNPYILFLVRSVA